MNNLRKKLTDDLLIPRSPETGLEVMRLAAILDMVGDWPPHAQAIFDQLIDRQHVAEHLQNAMDVSAAVEALRRGWEIEAKA